MTDKDNKPAGRDNSVKHSRRERPSERMFRRSRAAQARRDAKNKADSRLIIMLLNFSVLGALVLALAAVAAHQQINGGPPSPMWIWLAQDIVPGLTRGVAIGGAICIGFALWLYLIVRKRPK